ncbi:polysulfide reductase NrfD [Danxiaibacter flavus]|uniref:Polysulfide reductase NrfD n=1 Tax=Danxiaibacter flavus TaxID=3049108 RepID=A0ABV3ZHE7_9BACT|nr:polysulfide reductase NrfD [Chitinophagaceae bacterium DXS]
MEPIKIKLDKSNELLTDLMPRKFGPQGRLWVGFLLLVIIIGAVAYYRQLKHGLVVTDMRDFTSWGIYISNFVFFVAISLVGSLVSAILKLTNVAWRTPLVRISEIIAVAAITFAAIIIIVDMGRPDRFWHLFVYGRIQSPILWDVIVITTYFVVSCLLLYIPLLPDIAVCRDTAPASPRWKKRFYTFLALNWKGTSKQYAIIHKSINVLAVLVVPLALGIHTVTSWLFATTYRAGWDSSNFGPYFVAGAFQAGCAGVIAVTFVLRNHYNLRKYITNKHFDNLGKLLVLLSLIYLYFNINEYLVPGYKMKTVDGEHLHSLFRGSYAPLFWSVQIFGMILPIIVLLFKKGRKPLPIFIVSILVVVGAWFKRFLIVIPTLLHPFIPIQNVPESWHHYVPTWEEWAITSASLAGALLIITIFVRLFPIISIWETTEEKMNATATQTGDQTQFYGA